jgi:hypothetical protein
MASIKYFYKAHFDNGKFINGVLIDYEDNMHFNYKDEAYFDELITRLILFSKGHRQKENNGKRFKTIFGYIE